MKNTAGVLNQNFVTSENLKQVADELVSVASPLKGQVENFKTADRPEEETGMQMPATTSAEPDNTESSDGEAILS
jgi:hypothetical protein